MRPRLRRAQARVQPLRSVSRRRDLRQRGIPALELRGPAGRGDPAGPEEVLQRALDVRPVPAPSVGRTRLVVLECHLHRSRGHVATTVHLVEHRLDELGLLIEDPAKRPPRLLRSGPHPVVVQRPQGRVHEAGLVHPVLDQPPRRTVTGLVEQPPVVGAQPGEERQVVAADEHVDAVDLHDGHPVDDPLQVARRHGAHGRPRLGENLCGQGDPACLAKAEGAGGGPTGERGHARTDGALTPGAAR